MTRLTDDDMIIRDKKGRFIKGSGKLPNGIVYENHKRRQREYYHRRGKFQRDKIKELEYRRGWISRPGNRERARIAVKKWKESPLNRDKVLKYKRDYYYKNRERELEKASVYQKNHQSVRNERYRTDIAYRLNIIMSTSIRESLLGKKNHRKWQGLVGYGVNNLKAHLERLFCSGMSWDNYGKWEIDHIKPISSFCFESPNDSDFKECWSLGNLQPLWAKDNRIKSNKIN